MKNIFTNIYENAVRGTNNNKYYKGSSGIGSTVNFNIRQYVPFVKKLIKNKNIKTVVDLGCGDFLCGESIYGDLDITYYGYDAYDKIIEHHTKKYPKYNFTHLDFYDKKEEIMSADLCILKDVLQHWPVNEINIFLDYIVKKFKYILICNCCHQASDNQNIVTGQYRPLSSKMLPLIKYNPVPLLAYNGKEVSLITNIEPDTVTIAILAKDKEACLPYYLKCIEKQTYPKNKTYLYIRTNNNNDRTCEILEEWLEKMKDKYLDVYFDKKDVPEKVEQYTQHEWNTTRFKVLGKIRNDSIKYARERNSHYLVVDLDNFIYSDTLQTLLDTRMPVIGPMLLKNIDRYANYHHHSCPVGYYKNSTGYELIRTRHVKGLIEVSTVHCTYLVRNEFLKYANYDDGSNRYEYAIFSHGMRKASVPQYVDNRKDYGFLTFAENKKELEKDPMFKKLEELVV